MTRFGKLLLCRDANVWLSEQPQQRGNSLPKRVCIEELRKQYPNGILREVFHYPNGCPVLSEGPQKDDL